jgi:hypothetical protein
MTANIMTAQTKDYKIHEFSVFVAAGLSSISYKLNEGTPNNGFGGNLGVNYTYGFNKNLGIVTGLGFSTYSAKMSMNSDYEETYLSIDDSGDEFTLKYSLGGGYGEKQNAILLTIPLMAKYTIPLGKGALKYFASGGLKFGVPIISKATISPKTITTSGYYEYEDRTYSNLPEHGFTDEQINEQYKSNIRLGFATMLAIETGVRFPIGYKRGLTAGIYFDYSLNNVQKSNDMHMLEYQSIIPLRFVYNSVLNTVTVKKVNLLSVGLKIGININ